MPRVPVTIVTGFLGSGKTTRVNELLRAPHGRRLAVIVNEFGDIGIDASRLAGPNEFVELDGGCLCCQLNADLEATLLRLRDRGGFDHLLVETTGLADPLPVAWTFGRGELVEAFRVDAIVTVVDVPNLSRIVAESPEGRDQIERADLLLLSKLDLAPGSDAAVFPVLQALNPAARIVAAPRGELPWPLLLDVDAAPHRTGPSAHRHGTSFEAWSWQTEALVSDAALEEFLRTLPRSVYRVKGLLRTDAPWEWSQVDAVAGRYEIAPAAGEQQPRPSVLVCIGIGLDREALEAAARRLPVGEAPPP